MQTTVTHTPVNMEARKGLGLKAGDTARVWVRITETDNKGKEKTRLQAFEGLVLARKHGDEPGGTFTVRKVSNGVGIERIFPLYSPSIEKIEIIKRAKVRRSKLYYIRDKVAREAKRALRRAFNVSITDEVKEEEKEPAPETAEAPTENEAPKEAPEAVEEEKPTEAPVEAADTPAESGEKKDA